MDKRCVIKKLCLMTIGTFILSFGVYNFYYQNSITEGGVLGILLILKNLFDVNPSISNVIIDGLLILLGFKFFGKEFFGFTIFASLCFSTMYAICEKVGFLVKINNNIIAAILGGLCVGVGCSIIMNAGGASGGDDVLAIVLSKISKWRIGVIYLLTDISVLLLSLVYLPLDTMVYSIIAVITSGQVIDLLYKNENAFISETILAEKADEKLAA